VDEPVELPLLLLDAGVVIIAEEVEEPVDGEHAELAVETVALLARLPCGDRHGDDDVAQVVLAVRALSPRGKLRTSVGLSFFMNFRLRVWMARSPTKARVTSGPERR
jgi:hypothetical protein